MIEEIGGEAPCFAHLLQPPDLTDAAAAALLRELAEAVVISDVEGRIVFWNASAERLFGWPAEDALDRPLDLIIPPKHRARHWQGYRKVMASGSSKYSTQLLEVPALHRDGTTLSIAFTVTLTRDGARVTGIAAVIRDETERRRERQRLERQLVTRIPILGHPGARPL